MGVLLVLVGVAWLLQADKLIRIVNKAKSSEIWEKILRFMNLFLVSILINTQQKIFSLKKPCPLCRVHGLFLA